MAPRSEDPLRGAEVARVVRRDLERVVTATGVIKTRVGAEVRVGSRASGAVRERVFPGAVRCADRQLETVRGLGDAASTFLLEFRAVCVILSCIVFRCIWR
jgi:hypothetical protein